MATTMLWTAAGALIVLLAAWRLRRASRAVETILREERDRPDWEPAQAEHPVADGASRHKRR